MSSAVRRWYAAVAAVSTLAGLFMVAAPEADAAPVSAAASFTGGTGTATVGGTVFAKNGQAVTLSVTTDFDSKCIDVAGAMVAHQTSATPLRSWSVSSTAGLGDGAQAVTAAPSSDFNKNGGCTAQGASAQASYTLDNTGPVVAAALSPAANSAGWNNTGVAVAWTATDAGSGVSGAQPFRTDTVSANGIVTLTAPAQSDRLGNTGSSGSVTVRVDKAAPSITASQTKNADGTTTVTFTCLDGLSGIASCVADGSTTSSKTVQPGVTVTGTAIDTAGNRSTASSTAPAGDTTPPTLSGAPTTQPNANGWYKGDVTVHWTAADPESGIANAPADTTISGEGTGLTSTTTVTNGAGLSTTATSTPAVSIDRTAPVTGISGTSNNWTNGNVTVSLSASDNRSGVATTTYSVDGATPQNGTSFTLSAEGDHTITYFSTDKAGNVESTQTAHVKIDKTAPTIGHAFTPLAYANGAWTNQDVTVTFTCADQGGSGLAGCTSPVTESDEGQNTIIGTATDGAGNSATDTARVNIDKTPPTISAHADRAPNAAGWYNADVTVHYTADDALSGVTSSPTDDVLGGGANQSATGSATDAAGNTASAGVSGINVDETAPALDGTFTAGWHTDDVTVTWTCTDGLSGPAAQPQNSVVTGEGDNLSATTNCTDVAGNPTTQTVSGIKIDRTAPTTTADVPATPDSGWFTHSVSVTLTGDDNLSGVVQTYYRLDGGETESYSDPLTVTADGHHAVSFWSVDNAGNVEAAGAPITFDIDKTAPTTTVINPISPTGGWFVHSGIPFAFDAIDGGSGVAATYYTIDGGDPQTYGKPFTADLSDGRHSVDYWSVDLAGNAESDRSFDLQVDTTAPAISGDTVNADGTHRGPNDFGWFNSPVDVAFTCTDLGSGVAGCSGDTTLANDGAGQTVHGDALDKAGNGSSADVGPVNIDTTVPTLTGVPEDANAAGWYNHDVTVRWVGHDGLSGIDLKSQPADSTVTGEGRDLGAGPVTISDKAGNTSDAASVSGINIDRTAPVINGGPTTQPNAGWYRTAVTVEFTCSDPTLADDTAGSGVALCPTSASVLGDGADQSVTSGVATDVAGNVSDPITVGGINVDGTAPTSTANNLCTKVDGWCTGSTADVVITATDQAGLSGVKEIHYVVNGGTEQVVAGATATATVPLNGTGSGTVKYWAVDNAGNVERTNGACLKWDNIAPSVTHTLSPAANAAGWNNADVTVSFTAQDDDSGSGLAGVSEPVTVSSETAGQDVTGTASDKAGNVGTDKVTVKLDKTAPAITGAITSGRKGANGWYTGPVTVTFTCGDALSGVATCPDPVVLTANGANSATGTATDRAGNTASATVDGITIDQENPTLTTADVNVQGNTYTLGAVPAATCVARDSFSGVASCTVTVSGGNATGVGMFTYTATAVDKAGNTTTITGTYQVIYRWDGFLQPINDTAHQVGTSTSIFKAGSTVPVKFQLKKADGTVVQAVAAPVWLTPLKAGSTSAPVDESAYAATADSGSTYKYDSTAKQYIYNWKTGSTGGNYWRIGVTLDDGQTYYVNIGLR